MQRRTSEQSCLALASSITLGLVLLILSGISKNHPTTTRVHYKGSADAEREHLTLSADDYESDLSYRPMDCKLVIDFVNFLEAGLIFQTEDQDYCVHPTCKLTKGKNNSSQKVQEGRNTYSY